MGNRYRTHSHSKFLLQYHLIFVCKYRKKLLYGSNLIKDLKRLSAEICEEHNVIIHYMETDLEHIHYMIETTPNINLSRFIGTMKSHITYHLWEIYGEWLSYHFGESEHFLVMATLFRVLEM